MIKPNLHLLIETYRNRHWHERHQDGPPHPDCDGCLGLFRGKPRRPSPAPALAAEVARG